MTTQPEKPRVFIDADVLFAGAASPNEHSASLVVLRMAEITLINAIASEQVVVEAERNLSEKLSEALPAFRLLVSRCLTLVPNPPRKVVASYQNAADEKDLPILLAAHQADCDWLVTFNVRHFQPGLPQIVVLRPGELVLRVRDRLAHL